MSTNLKLCRSFVGQLNYTIYIKLLLQKSASIYKDISLQLVLSWECNDLQVLHQITKFALSIDITTFRVNQAADILAVSHAVAHAAWPPYVGVDLMYCLYTISEINATDTQDAVPRITSEAGVD